MTSATLGDYVEVGRFTLLADARLAEALLRGDGLDVHLQGHEFVGTLPHMADAVGGVRVYVPAQDAERAREVLAHARGEPQPAAAPDADDAAEPPRDAAAKRAFIAAVLGIVFLPGVLHAISLWQLAVFARGHGPASPRALRRAIVAAIVDVGVLAAVVLYLARRG